LTHIEAVRELFRLPDIERVLLSLAFVNEEGVRAIEADLKPFADRTTVFSGVRNEITSLQGLARLVEIGVSLFTVDTGARHIVFHPKIYLVRGKKVSGLLTGSANLTLGGLNNNVEASVALDFDMTEKKDVQLIDEIESQILSLPKQYPENIEAITSIERLVEFKNAGRLLDEAEAAPPRPASSRQVNGATDNPIPRIKLEPKRMQGTIRRKKIAAKVQPVVAVPISIPSKLELVWQSKELTERDLNISSATNTHATGSINLDKGLLAEDIDHRHYFRDDVFPDLTWTEKSDTVEEAEADFGLVIKDVDYGVFRLPIRHTTDTESRSYEQRNAMTRLSWGPMKEFLANRDLIGRTLSLYRDKDRAGSFVLEID
jgi:HKD family nuclease